MKRIYISLLVIGIMGGLLFASSSDIEPEIIIEMQGEADTKPQFPSLWTQTTRQLSRRLKGKTREQVLYDIPIVSDKDRVVRSAQQEYALVEYYHGEQFRKFLFKAETPQMFIAAASNAADVLAINKKYGINIGLSQKYFENLYGNNIQKETVETLPTRSVLYKVNYTDINTKNPQERWFLFEKQKLSTTFETLAEKETYIKNVQPVPVPSVPAPKPKASPQRKPFKALLSGGTVQDQMYMPRVVNPERFLAPSTSKNRPETK